MKTYAIVPVHEFSVGKTRLGRALRKKERAELSLAMMSDVLDALCRSRELERVVLVTRDADATCAALMRGAMVLWEGHSHGLNRAVRRGIRFAEREGADQVLIIPADIPLAKPADIARILREGRKSDVTIVPSYDDGGTNALLLRPPRVIPVSYGRSSYRRHCRLARNRTVRLRILRLPSLQLDIDRPLDLKRACAASGNTRSQLLLRKLVGH